MTYRMVVPPGWVPLSALPQDAGETARTIDGIVAAALPDSLPRDRAQPWREELRRHLTGAVDDARDADAQTVWLPVRTEGTVGIPASFTVAEIVDASATDPAVLAATMATSGDPSETTTQVRVDGALGVRTESVEQPDPVMNELATVPARRVSYTLAVPGRTAHWLLINFVTLGEGDPRGVLADALVDLFDALVTTLRWTDEPAV